MISKLLKSVGLILIMVTVFACDEELTQFTINSELSKEINVEVPEDGHGQGVSYEDIIDTSQDSDLVQNRQKIKEMEVKRVSFSISEYEGPDSATLTGDVSIGEDSDQFTATIEELSLQLISGTDYVIDLEQEELDKLANLLMNSNQLDVKFTGSVSDSPADFTLKITVETKAIVDAE